MLPPSGICIFCVLAPISGSTKFLKLSVLRSQPSTLKYDSAFQQSTITFVPGKIFIMFTNVSSVRSARTTLMKLLSSSSSFPEPPDLYDIYVFKIYPHQFPQFCPSHQVFRFVLHKNQHTLPICDNQFFKV